MNTLAALGAMWSIFLAMFAVFVAVWYSHRKDRRPHYLLRSARKYSISPLFGQSRETLLREAEKLRA